MKGIIKLKNPLKMGDKELTELKYDTDLITAQDFIDADAYSCGASTAKNQVKITLSIEFDRTFHFYLGCYAIIRAQGNVDIMDLKRLGGHDAIKVTAVGRDFTTESAAEDEEEATADTLKTPTTSSTEASGVERSIGMLETIPESTTPAETVY